MSGPETPLEHRSQEPTYRKASEVINYLWRFLPEEETVTIRISDVDVQFYRPREANTILARTINDLVWSSWPQLLIKTKIDLRGQWRLQSGRLLTVLEPLTQKRTKQSIPKTALSLRESVAPLALSRRRARSPLPPEPRDNALEQFYTKSELEGRFGDLMREGLETDNWSQLNGRLREKRDWCDRLLKDPRFQDITPAMIRAICIRDTNPEATLLSVMRKLSEIKEIYPHLRIKQIRSIIRMGVRGALKRAESFVNEQRHRTKISNGHSRRSNISLDAARFRDGRSSTHEYVAARGDEASAAKVVFEEILTSGVLNKEEEELLSTYLDSNPTDADTQRVVSMLKRHQSLMKLLAMRLQRFDDTGL